MPALAELYQEVIVCQRCDLAKQRTRAVPGEGREDAEIMFIGEGPGWHEDQQGRPFVGPAGQFLNELLASVGLKREEVYITNVVKCRPPGNRDPLPSEIQSCREYLERQTRIIRPRVIVTLGRYSMALFFPGKSISKIHGTAQKGDGVTYFAMYHPAAALHQQSLRQAIQQDMLKLPPLLAETKRSAAPEQPEQQPRQLTMFEI
ncbi:MAG: uracil-DNA glycosylase [Chloroflexi bacterium]|nr:uracil-DNA glycosylase [Chloroflexota bacterium]